MLSIQSLTFIKVSDDMLPEELVNKIVSYDKNHISEELLYTIKMHKYYKELKNINKFAFFNTVDLLLKIIERSYRYKDINITIKYIIELLNTVYFTLTQNNIFNKGEGKNFINTVINKINNIIDSSKDEKFDKMNLEDLWNLKKLFTNCKKIQKILCE